MNSLLIWASNSTYLGTGKRLKKVEYDDGQKLRITFKKWLIKTKKATECAGEKGTTFGGITMSWHNNCCDTFSLKYKVPIEQALTEFVKTEYCQKAWIEAHAKHALLYYQKCKAECKPNSKTGMNKTKLALARKQRQQWTDYLKVWEKAHEK